ncbi:MAG: hypothetical protein H7249_07240 [Chitinophagaceae bacterium]|nr:hypothetical protein [Oligoflexus sp.]
MKYQTTTPSVRNVSAGLAFAKQRVVLLKVNGYQGPCIRAKQLKKAATMEAYLIAIVSTYILLGSTVMKNNTRHS